MDGWIIMHKNLNKSNLSAKIFLLWNCSICTCSPSKLFYGIWLFCTQMSAIPRNFYLFYISHILFSTKLFTEKYLLNYIWPALICGFCSMMWLEIFVLPPLDRMLIHRTVNPRLEFAGTYLCTWLERGTVRLKCLLKNTTQRPLNQSSNLKHMIQGQHANHQANLSSTLNYMLITYSDWLLKIIW